MATYDGAVTTPGLARVDLATCSVAWESEEIAPSVVPKLSAANGLVYTYTKPPGDPEDPWYLTALDWETGETVFEGKRASLPRQGRGELTYFRPIVPHEE